MVDVSNEHKNITVEVSNKHKSFTVEVENKSGNTNITASSDTAQYWSKQSRLSAENSKESAQEAKEYAELANSYIENFEGVIANAETELTAIKDAGVQEINTAVTDGKTEITTTKDLAIDAVNNTKTTILNDIEFVADGEKQEIEDLIDNGKEELKESIDGIKVLTTLEIGDIGFTQMAIDESKGKRRILNGQLIIQDQYVEFTNIIKNSVALNPDLACTEAEWQTAITMSTNGVCEKFVIDDEAGTIRLPKYPQYLDLTNNASAKTQTVSIKGNGKTLGLTNGTNNFGFGTRSQNWNGSLGSTFANVTINSSVSTTSPGNSNPPNGVIGITTDASKSGLTGSVTVPAVTSEKIKGQYFIQVATGVETEDNIINEIELNNPFSLLDYKWSEYELNNLSWLRSNGQYNSKAVYPAVYDLLLKIYNGTETKAGVSVKLSTDGHTDYDFVLNTAEETFRLPIKVKDTPFEITGASTTLSMNAVSIKGDGKNLGLTKGGTDTGSIGVNTSVSALAWNAGAYGGNVGTTISNSGMGNAKSMGVTTDASKSGLTGSVTGTATTTVNTRQNASVMLYFYVGETVQNANLINAGRIEEKKVNKAGDTMTGRLLLEKAGTAGLVIKDSVYAVADVPTSSTTTSSLEFYDKNNVWSAICGIEKYTDGRNCAKLQVKGASGASGAIRVFTYADGKIGFNFPMCTTKATTTSSARTDLVAVVTQNYVNGTSWYRIYSDGWKEQGGQCASGSSGTTVTFLKAFSNTNYTVVITNISSNHSDSAGTATKSSASSMVVKNAQGRTYSWYACGY